MDYQISAFVKDWSLTPLGILRGNDRENKLKVSVPRGEGAEDYLPGPLVTN